MALIQLHHTVGALHEDAAQQLFEERAVERNTGKLIGCLAQLLHCSAPTVELGHHRSVTAVNREEAFPIEHA